MATFDQAGRFAAHYCPEATLRRVMARAGMTAPFREWYDTRALPLPRGPDRTADLVADLEVDPDNPPTLVVLECQSEHDPDKLDVTLEEAAIIRARTRHGADRKGKYRVLTALVYLQGRCPENVLDMTTPTGFGTRHVSLVWNVADDDAAWAVEEVAAGREPWGLLFWVMLMAGGGEAALIARWKEVLLTVVPEKGMRANVIAVAPAFAELAGCRPAWEKGLEGFDMRESQVIKGWEQKGEVRGQQSQARKALLTALRIRFAGEVPEEIVKLIGEQESVELLDDWHAAAVGASSFDEFLSVLKQ